MRLPNTLELCGDWGTKLKTDNDFGNSYSKLRKKTFIKGIQITGIAVVIVLIVRSLSYGKLGDVIVDFFVHTLGFDFEKVISIYQAFISGNIEIILAITIIIFMLILFRMLLNSYTKYLDEVISGIEKVSFTNKDKITLSPELRSVEQKLNSLNETLIRQDKEKKEMEQQKNDMLVYLAHDIKTPLTSILGYLSLIEMDKRISNEEKDKYIKIATQKAERLENLINEFFEIAQYSLQNVPLKKENIDLHYMMVQIREEMYPSLANANKSLDMDIPEEMVIWGNPDKLARVFINLIKNAIAYSEDGNVISVVSKEGEDKSTIMVKSRGTISHNDIDSIFDKFSRLNTARSSSTGGAGLGLAISKDIVELHSGHISAVSEDDLTLFIVEIPRDNNPSS